jgi:hypothetical protein
MLLYQPSLKTKANTLRNRPRQPQINLDKKPRQLQTGLAPDRSRPTNPKNQGKNQQKWAMIDRH